MLACVRDGRAGVQDEGSQLVALALARAEVDGDAGEWLDSAPGRAARRPCWTDSRPSVAGTSSPWSSTPTGPISSSAPSRPDRPRWSSPATPGSGRGAERTFDRVLVDAPCTGLGALRRRPESRWRRTTADLAALGATQRDLLRAGVDAARPGGVVAYVTCSPHLAETEFVVSDVLRGRTDVVQEDARPLVPEVTDVGDGPGLQLWPTGTAPTACSSPSFRKR